ncbi:MAG: PQQ-binding-like beta-propeller repeat protein [Candidatus Hydrogenedentes bacterium]|nr:PQQ-binding-like beta-propeller repeat protein [Candidatus Hydrogenedentota bacterium]
MKYPFLLIIATVFVSFHLETPARADEGDNQVSVAPTDWAWWRGPNRNGIATADQTPPLQWSEEKNVLWKSLVPGRGHGSPTVVGDRIFLATADEEREIQSVLCYDRKSGQQRWKTDIHQGGFASSSGREGNIRSSKASGTVACDGERVFINFINDNAVYLTALSLEGKQLWQKKVTDYATHQGYGSSPAIYGPLVILAADNKGGGALSAYDRVTGELVWTQKRPELPNYTSPIILKVDGRDQVLLVGCNLISSYAPLTGKINWEVEGATTECVTSTVTDGKSLVTSGGYPSKHISVVRGDGSGDVLWRNDTMVYVPSMLVHGDHLYVVTDSGEVLCYEFETGNVVWEHRIRGKFAASPVLVGEDIFATSNKGVTYIFKATPKGFELLHENELMADEVQATPAICDSKIYLRIVRGKKDQRQEMLYCLGQGT